MLRNLIILTMALTLSVGNLFAGDIAVPDTSKVNSFKMAQARLKYSNNDFEGALKSYRDMLKKHPDNDLLNYRVGECYYALKKHDKALPYLEKSVGVANEAFEQLHFYLGRIYHQKHNYQKAINHYKQYKKAVPEKDFIFQDADRYLSNAENAIQFKNNPYDIKIDNMGPSINSKYVDSNPSMTADGNTLIYTSRRPDEPDDPVDPNTGEFYDDIYISYKNKDGSWSEGKALDGRINSKGHDANTSISPDGKVIFVYKNIKDKTGSGDIYYSRKKDNGKWQRPRPLGKEVNSTYFETSACLTADYNSLFFVSERERGGYGEGDIYMATKVGKEFGKARNLGKKINTPFDEIGAFIHPDGKTLFFTSNCKESMGGYDIFMSTFNHGRWSDPINLGYPINTPYNEYHFTLSADSRTAFISSDRDGGMGKADIYKADMEAYFQKAGLTFAAPKLTIIKGTIVDENQMPLSTPITVKDMKTRRKVAEIESDDKGKYFITLNSGRSYEFRIKVRGMKPIKTIINVPNSKKGTETMTWHFILSEK